MWLVINETEILLLKILLSLVRPKPARSSLTRPAVGSLCIIPGGGGRQARGDSTSLGRVDFTVNPSVHVPTQPLARVLCPQFP